MEIDIERIPYHADKFELKTALATVLHSPEFFSKYAPKARPMNFGVVLEESKLLGYQNNSVGVLQLPTYEDGLHFMKWVRLPENKIKVRGGTLKFIRKGPLPNNLRETLQKVPYIDPCMVQEREQKIAELDGAIRISTVQIGALYFNSETKSRAFSVEWDYDCVDQDPGWLRVYYEHRVIRIDIGDPVKGAMKRTLVIKLSSINRMERGVDMDAPYILFDLSAPAIIDKEEYYRSYTGDARRDAKYRQRMTSFDDAHAQVSPYAHHIRLVLFCEDDLAEFDRCCDVTNVRRPACPASPTEAARRCFFSVMKLREVQCWIASVDWPVAFQIETILHNGLATTEDVLEDLMGPIIRVYEEDRAWCAALLRRVVESLQSPTRPPNESVLQCFTRVEQEKDNLILNSMPPGMFSCCHVTFTPTRMLLEGPYAIQSNRVVRRYKDHGEHFLRVDFRDEDRLQYRWEREVDGSSFLTSRVGCTLKSGFKLGGRHFKYEFLAYSSSALKEHSVWFVRPFPNTEAYAEWHDPGVHMIDAHEIRTTLGDFTGVSKQPAKYAARMAQAFTATDPSVKIRREQWEEVKDLGQAPYEHTDGVGCISPDLANEIWEALCRATPYLASRPVKPSAYQIRFLGYKGMVGVDERMEGKRMILRPSMNKFMVHNQDEAEIEIARAFDRPMVCMLSRPLIMILEDRGVHRDAFMKLQNAAKAEVMTSGKDLAQYRSMLVNHSLGSSYRLPYIAENLMKLTLDLRSTPNAGNLEYGFFRRLGHYAIHHSLREIKHNSRIPIDGWLLPGIADEGPRYQAEGERDVEVLGSEEIYVCVQGPDDEAPRWIRGRCSIWRAPTVHPGDVQQVYAIGKPPAGKLCSFRNLKNVVVLPSMGSRSLASKLGGGDVDGDLFYVTQDQNLFPTIHHEPASYDAASPFTLPDGRKATIEDVCDFVVNYINSDVLGLLSSQHLVIADQSKDGTLDKACLELARLCGLAVDYPKSGVPIDITHSPRRLIPYPPDWSAAEVLNIDKTHYYESSRALGHLFRDFDLPTQEDLERPERGDECTPLRDNVSVRVLRKVQRFAKDMRASGPEPEWLAPVFAHYAAELRYICATHTLASHAGRLSEEEVVIGTILAKCSQRRWRKDRIQRVKMHSRVLVRATELALLDAEVGLAGATHDELLAGLRRAWAAWCFSVRRGPAEGAQSFGLIALALIFACLEALEGLSPSSLSQAAPGPTGAQPQAKPPHQKPGSTAQSNPVPSLTSMRAENQETDWWFVTTGHANVGTRSTAPSATKSAPVRSPPLAPSTTYTSTGRRRQPKPASVKRQAAGHEAAVKREPVAAASASSAQTASGTPAGSAAAGAPASVTAPTANSVVSGSGSKHTNGGRHRGEPKQAGLDGTEDLVSTQGAPKREPAAVQPVSAPPAAQARAPTITHVQSNTGPSASTAATAPAAASSVVSGSSSKHRGGRRQGGPAKGPDGRDGPSHPGHATKHEPVATQTAPTGPAASASKPSPRAATTVTPRPAPAPTAKSAVSGSSSRHTGGGRRRREAQRVGPDADGAQNWRDR